VPHDASDEVSGGARDVCDPTRGLFGSCSRPLFKTRLQAVISKVRQTSKSHVVHCGRDVFPEGVEKVDASQVPGLRDLNWNPAMDELSVPSSH
jgi:hypothetical protein